MTKVVNHFLKMGEVKGSQSDDLHFFDYEEESMKNKKWLTSLRMKIQT